MRGQIGVRDRCQPSGQGRGDDDQTHRLVHDHNLQRDEAKHTDQQRQPELRPAKSDHPAENADPRATDERQRQ